jgi:antitoxin MazE
MVTKVQKWGNSLGIRIPKSLAEDARVEAGSSVDISLADGQLVIKPVRSRKYELKRLLSKVTKDNVHREISSGDPQGKEAW